MPRYSFHLVPGDEPVSDGSFFPDEAEARLEAHRIAHNIARYSDPAVDERIAIKDEHGLVVHEVYLQTARLLDLD